MQITNVHQHPTVDCELPQYRYREAAFQRNIGFVTPGEQERLFEATVAIPGLGGAGGAHLTTLARLGVGRFHLADFDHFEPVNVNRQFGAQVGHFGRPKTEVMARAARAINPYAILQIFPEGVSEDNLDEFLEGVDVVVDSMDFFNFDIRRAIFNRAWQKKIHVVTAGPMGFGTALLVFAPDRGMQFDRYFDIREEMSLEEKLIAFMVGLAPKSAHKGYVLPGSISMSGQRGPSLGAGCQLCAAAAAAEVVRIVLKKPGLRPAPFYFQYDPFVRKFHQGRLWFGNRGPIQRFKQRVLKSQLGPESDYLSEPKPELPATGGIDSGHLSGEIVDFLMDAARRAPSGDNCQPWRFTRHGNTVRITLDPAADRSFFNVAQSASLISCGAAAENLSLAATCFGLQTRVKVVATAEAAHLDIELMSGQASEDPLQRFLWERHTNRTRYDGSPLATGDLDRLHKAIDGFAGAHLVMLTDSQDIKDAARIVFAVDRIRTGHRGLHQHLMRMIRFSAREAIEKRDGFALPNLEAGRVGNWLIRCLRPWPVMAVLNRLGVGKLMSAVSYQGIRSASAVGMLKVTSARPFHLIEGGRALERLWLTASRLGLAFQPMTAATLFWLRWQREGQTAFSEDHGQLLAEMWPHYRRLFEVHDQNEGPIMLFRVGRGRAVRCRTLRKPLSWLKLSAVTANPEDARVIDPGWSSEGPGRMAG